MSGIEGEGEDLPETQPFREEISGLEIGEDEQTHPTAALDTLGQISLDALFRFAQASEQQVKRGEVERLKALLLRMSEYEDSDPRKQIANDALGMLQNFRDSNTNGASAETLLERLEDHVRRGERVMRGEDPDIAEA